MQHDAQLKSKMQEDQLSNSKREYAQLKKRFDELQNQLMDQQQTARNLQQSLQQYEKDTVPGLQSQIAEQSQLFQQQR